jgi:hypothetical protein
MQSSPRNSPAPTKASVASFPFAGGDSYSQPALLHVKNRVGSVALRVGRLILLQIENLLAQSSSRQKGLGIENRIAIFGFDLRRFEREGFEISPVVDFADRTELADGIRLAGRPWLRVGMASSAHFIPPKGQRPYTSRLYLLKKPGTCAFSRARPSHSVVPPYVLLHE